MNLFDQPSPANTAIISDCGQYRYLLTRQFGGGSKGNVLWIMLNPSTADASLDDPTIRKCIGFTKQFGCDSLSVVNLFSLRATDPKVMLKHNNPVGDDNLFTDTLCAELKKSEMVILAWGTNGSHQRRDSQVINKILCAGIKPDKILCLAKTKDGYPKHPLYCPYGKPPETFYK